MSNRYVIQHLNMHIARLIGCDADHKIHHHSPSERPALAPGRISSFAYQPRPAPGGACNFRPARHSFRERRHSRFQSHPRLGRRDWHDTIDVNLTGTCNAVRAVAPHLVRNGGGRIIVTASTQGRHGTKYGAAYSASKIGLMKSAALELGEYGITVNAVIPRLIDTPLTRHRDRYAQAADEFNSKKPTAELEAEAKKKLIAKSPFGIPWIEPEAIAPVVVFLASDDARMVSGATYDVTGGDSANYTA